MPRLMAEELRLGKRFDELGVGLLLRSSVFAHRRLRQRFIIAVVSDQILQQRVAIGVLRAPTGHLIELAGPPRAGQSLRVNDAETVARHALALLLFLSAIERGLVGAPCRGIC